MLPNAEQLAAWATPGSVAALVNCSSAGAHGHRRRAIGAISQLAEPPEPRVMSRRSAQVAAPPPKVQSATTPGWLWAGLAVGYASRGAWDAAATHLGKAGGYNRDAAREAALEEMGAMRAPGTSNLAGARSPVPAMARAVLTPAPGAHQPLARTVRRPGLGGARPVAQQRLLRPQDKRGCRRLGLSRRDQRLAGPTELRRILKFLVPE